MSQTYIIECANNKYYIKNVHKVVSDSFKYLTSPLEYFIKLNNKWINQYIPINISLILDDIDCDNIVLYYMEKYGIKNVRGGKYEDFILTEKQLVEITSKIVKQSNCAYCMNTNHLINNCDAIEYISIPGIYKYNIIKETRNRKNKYDNNNIIFKTEIEMFDPEYKNKLITEFNRFINKIKEYTKFNRLSAIKTRNINLWDTANILKFMFPEELKIFENSNNEHRQIRLLLRITIINKIKKLLSDYCMLKFTESLNNNSISFTLENNTYHSMWLSDNGQQKTLPYTQYTDCIESNFLLELIKLAQSNENHIIINHCASNQEVKNNIDSISDLIDKIGGEKINIIIDNLYDLYSLDK